MDLTPLTTRDTVAVPHKNPHAQSAKATAPRKFLLLSIARGADKGFDIAHTGFKASNSRALKNFRFYDFPTSAPWPNRMLDMHTAVCYLRSVRMFARRRETYMSRIEGVDGREAEDIRQDYLRSLDPDQKAEYLTEYERRAGQDYSDETFYATGYYDKTAEGSHSISIGELALLNADERKVNAENLDAITVFHATTPFRLHRFALIDLGPITDPGVFDRTVEGTTYESTEDFLASLGGDVEDSNREADGDESGTVSPAPNSEPAHVEQEKPIEVPEWPKARAVRDEPQA